MTLQTGDIHALTRVYDLLLWIIPVLEKYPKTQKFLLADRIETGLLDIQDLLLQAVYTKQKLQALHQSNMRLEQIRFLIRLSKDLRFLGLKQYEHASGRVDEIGREIGGWIRHCRGQETQ